MEKTKKILIIEDSERIQNSIKSSLGRYNVNILSAFTIEEAETIFAENPDIDLIVIDACVPGDEPTTIPLTKKIRRSYNGPIIASSNSAEYRKLLMYAGCNKEVSKYHLLDYLKNFLESGL